MSYNLTDNVNDDFKFTINGVEYKMRYPLVEEIDTLQELVTKQTEAQGDEAKAAVGKEMQAYTYSFISPTVDGGASIGDVLDKVNIKVLKNFNHMVQTEFGVS